MSERKRGRLVVETRTWNGRLFQRELVHCNKARCRTCPHGPYWYSVAKRRDGRTFSRYVGKVPPWEQLQLQADMLEAEALQAREDGERAASVLLQRLQLRLRGCSDEP